MAQTQTQKKILYKSGVEEIFSVTGPGSVKLVRSVYPLTVKYANRVEYVVEVEGSTVEVYKVHHSWNGTGPEYIMKVDNKQFAEKVRQKMAHVNDPKSFQSFWDWTQEAAPVPEEEEEVEQE